MIGTDLALCRLKIAGPRCMYGILCTEEGFPSADSKRCERAPRGKKWAVPAVSGELQRSARATQIWSAQSRPTDVPRNRMGSLGRPIKRAAAGRRDSSSNAFLCSNFNRARAHQSCRFRVSLVRSRYRRRFSQPLIRPGPDFSKPRTASFWRLDLTRLLECSRLASWAETECAHCWLLSDNFGTTRGVRRVLGMGSGPCGGHRLCPGQRRHAARQTPPQMVGWTWRLLLDQLLGPCVSFPCENGLDVGCVIWPSSPSYRDIPPQGSPGILLGLEPLPSSPHLSSPVSYSLLASSLRRKQQGCALCERAVPCSHPVRQLHVSLYARTSGTNSSDSLLSSTT